MHRGLFHCSKGSIGDFNQRVSLGELTECMETFTEAANTILSAIGTTTLVSRSSWAYGLSMVMHAASSDVVSMDGGRKDRDEL